MSLRTVFSSYSEYFGTSSNFESLKFFRTSVVIPMMSVAAAIARSPENSSPMFPHRRSERSCSWSSCGVLSNVMSSSPSIGYPVAVIVILKSLFVSWILVVTLRVDSKSRYGFMPPPSKTRLPLVTVKSFCLYSIFPFLTMIVPSMSGLSVVPLRTRSRKRSDCIRFVLILMLFLPIIFRLRSTGLLLSS